MTQSPPSIGGSPRTPNQVELAEVLCEEMTAPYSSRREKIEPLQDILDSVRYSLQEAGVKPRIAPFRKEPSE